MSILEIPLTVRSWAMLLGAAALTAPASAADRIILRDNRVISDRSVAAFDPDGIVFAGLPALRLTWDEVEAGRVDRDQERFDELLRELGGPLYRIRRRLAAGDDRDVLEYAEALFPTFKDRRSASAFLVFVGLARGFEAHGRTEDVLAPYLLAVECLRAAPGGTLPLPGDQGFRHDPDSKLSPLVLPIWRDPAAAKRALPGAIEALDASAARKPAGSLAYVATLAAAAGDRSTCDRLLAEAKASNPPKAVADLIAIVEARLRIETPQERDEAIETLARIVDNSESSQRPLARYWLGIARLRAEEESERKRGLISLLALAALHGDDRPELAAEGLDAARIGLEASGDPSASILRSELLFRFPATAAAARLNAEFEAEATGSPSRP